MYKFTKAFTLVELIVVITILSILGTIAFISLQGYSRDSRDSVRISDLSKMKTGLEMFHLGSGKYPETTNPQTITYGGLDLWYQGSFGDSTYSNVSSLDKIPHDPSSNKEYTYSLTTNKQEYQLAGIMEGSDLVQFPTTQTNAAQKTATLKIVGNYNGKLLKVNSGSTLYVLAVPSIVASEGILLSDIITNNALAYDGYKNLPLSYSGTSYEVKGESALDVVNEANLVVYSGSQEVLSSDSDQGVLMRAQLVSNLQNAYSGTVLSSIGEIEEIINLNSGKEKAILSANIVNNNLGGKLQIDIITNNYLINVTDCGTIEGEVIYGTDDGTDTDLTCNNDIIVCNGISGSGITLSACNAGATLVFSGQTFTSDSSPRTEEVNAWAGGIYQWGNSFDISLMPLVTELATSVTEDSTYVSNRFIGGANVTTSTPNETMWIKPMNFNLWGHETNTDLARKGPCNTGYHTPEGSEWGYVLNTLPGGWNDEFKAINVSNALKLPFAGMRNPISGNMFNQGSGFNAYGSSTGTGGRIGSAILQDGRNGGFGMVGSGTSNWMANGYPIRCFKNRN